MVNKIEPHNLLEDLLPLESCKNLLVIFVNRLLIQNAVDHKEFDLLDFVTDSRFVNVQSKYLEGVKIKDFVICGFVEEMEKSLDNLSFILPLNTSNISNTKINYNLDKVGELYSLLESDELVRKANSNDYKLYQNAKSLFLK